MSNRDDEMMSEEGARNPLVEGATGGGSPIRTVWERTGEGHPVTEPVELPDFEIVRKGFSQDQVREYVTQLTGRVRNLERQLDEQRLGGERLRHIEQEFGDPGVLLEKIDGLERELNETRSALDAALADQEASRGTQDQNADEVGRLRTQVAQLEEYSSRLKSELDARNREVRSSGGPDAYGAIASQVAELLRSAGVQAEQIRREATEEADRQLEEARQEAASIRREAEADAEGLRGDARIQADRIAADRDEVLRQARAEAEEIKHEADAYADAVRREAQQESERIGTEREEVLRDARAEADRIRGAATTETERQRDETERVLLKARGDAERMLSAAVSRRDLVRAEMQAMRERLVGVIELLEPVAEGSEPGASKPADGGSPNGQAVEAQQEELQVEGSIDAEDQQGYDDVDAVGAEISDD